MRWFLIAALAVVGCKKAPEPAPAPVPTLRAGAAAPFWAWVAANVDALKAVKTGQEPVTTQLVAELEKVAPGLAWELGSGTDPFELIISADGNKALFPVVKQLVEAAPPIEGVKVIAFRPRKKIAEFSLKLGEQTLGGKDLWFAAGEDPDRKGLLGVDVFVVGLRSERDEKLKNAAFMLLEAAAGEYDLETKIGAIEFKPAPANPGSPLRPLTDLPAVLDARK